MEKTINGQQKLRLCISYAQNPANTHPCSLDEFLSVGTSQQVVDICVKISQLPNDKEHKEERQALKKQLPAFCFNSKRFKDNYRKNENATPSGLCMIDWDGVDDPEAFLSSFGQTREEQTRQLKLCGLAGFHLSASGHGFHGIIVMRPDETIEQAQARVARFMNKEDYDKAAHALSQCSFAVPAPYWLFLEHELLIDNEADETHLTPAVEANAQHIEEAVILTEKTTSEEQDAYDGVPMQLLINNILYEIMHLKEAPAEGTRNNRYFELARYARYFCDFDPETLLRVTPDWGLPEAERRDVCMRAVKYERVMGLPRQLQEMLERLKAEIKLSEGLNLAMTQSDEGLRLPDNLPKSLHLLIKLMPTEYRNQAFFCALPALGALTTALRYKHHEVHEERTSFQVYLCGQMASGKGFTRVLDRIIMAPIDADDANAMARETDYREECQAAGDGKKQRDPHNVIRRIQPDFTVQGLRKQLFNSRGQHMMIYSEESDSVTMNKQVSSLLRNAFDGSKTGQTRASVQSINGQADTLINTMLCGTPAALQRMLSNPEDGLVSRHIFVDQPDRLGFDEPEFGHLSPKEMRELESEMMRLHKIGLLENVQNDPLYQPEHTPVMIDRLPRTEEFIKQFTASIKLSFVMDGCKNIALEKFSRRLPTFIRRIAMVLWALEGCRETTRSIDILRFAAPYILQVMLNHYGHQYELIYYKSIQTQSPYKYKSKNSELINLLPDTFSLEDVIVAQRNRGIACSIDNAYVIISRLKGYVEPTGEPRHWRKVKDVA